MIGLAKNMWKQARRRPMGGGYLAIFAPTPECRCLVCARYARAVSVLTEDGWGIGKPWGPDPYACPLSQHPDGHHTTSWFNGGPCYWCGAS
jgi:hypothetical protein